MCSYNAVNGVPSCANGWLLETVARKEWGFDGYVVSDCDAVADVFTSHHFTDTAEEAVAAVLKAGTDVDCACYRHWGRRDVASRRRDANRAGQSFVGENAAKVLKQGLITEADIDARLRNTFRVRFRLGHFDLSMDSSEPRGPLDRFKASDVVCSAESIEASMEGMIQSAALLKNEATLPLKRGKRVAVVGPNALLSRSDSSYYGPGDVCGGNFWTLVDALAKGSANVSYAPGLPSVGSNDTSGIADAVSAAADADVVVLAVGTDLSMAAEARDADGIAFTNAQAELISRVSAAAKAPVIVVVFTATPLDLTDVLANAKVGAVLHVGQPSVTILGLGDVLYGDRPPAGRLVQTIHEKSFQDQISIFVRRVVAAGAAPIGSVGLSHAPWAVCVLAARLLGKKHYRLPARHESWAHVPLLHGGRRPALWLWPLVHVVQIHGRRRRRHHLARRAAGHARRVGDDAAVVGGPLGARNRVRRQRDQHGHRRQRRRRPRLHLAARRGHRRRAALDALRL
jgi:hypothetical protein